MDGSVTVSDEIGAYDGRVPNFMVAGEQKAGTSYMYHHLRRHPQIFMARMKEPLFFSKSNFDPAEIPGYLREHFSAAKNQQWVGEASPSYFHAEKAADRIMDAFGPQMKFIICLRHPTEKTVSLYLHNYRRGRLRGDEGLMDLEETPFRMREFTSHSKECARFLDIFGPANVHFVLFEVLRSSPSAFVESALSFLGLDLGPAPFQRILNKGNDLTWDGETLTIADEELPSAEQVRPQFRKADLELLHESLQEDVEQTEQITGLDLSSWKSFPYMTSLVALGSAFLPALPDLLNVLPDALDALPM